MNTRIIKVGLMVVLNVAMASMSVMAAPYDIGSDMAKDGFWTKPKSAFKEHMWMLGPWGKNTCGTSLRGAVTCFDIPVWSTNVRFSENGVDNVELSFFNTKGPMVPRKLENGATSYTHVPEKIGSREFDDLVKEIAKKFDGDDSLALKRKSDTMKQKGVYAFEMDLKGIVSGVAASLKWCYKRRENKSSEEAFDGEYITLFVQGKNGTEHQTAGAAPMSKEKTQENPVKENGDVFVCGIDVFDRGFEDVSCVAALERIFVFYGLDIGKSELDSVASAKDEMNTSWNKLKKVAAKFSKSHRFRFEIRYDDIPEIGVESLSSSAAGTFLAQYNRTAAKMKKDRLPQSDDMLHTVFSRKGVEPEVFKEMMTTSSKYAGKQKSFYKYVFSRIDKGAPILWRAEAGLFKSADEDNGRMMGTVMPWILIGYNREKKEFLYLDRERGGRDFKRIPFDWAWTITRGTFSLDLLKRKK